MERGGNDAAGERGVLDVDVLHPDVAAAAVRGRVVGSVPRRRAARAARERGRAEREGQAAGVRGAARGGGAASGGHDVGTGAFAFGSMLRVGGRLNGLGPLPAQRVVVP